MTEPAATPLLAFVGVATEDAIAVVPRYPGEDERIVADDICFGGGGPAATAAVAAARLGIHTALVAAVGDDDAGDSVVSRLQSEGVDTSGVRRIRAARTARSVVVISGTSKVRAISNQIGPDLDIAADDDIRELLRSSAWVHADHHGWAAARSVLATFTDAPRLSVDAGNEIPEFTVSGTTLYVPTREALTARYGRLPSDDIETLLERAVHDGAEYAVATSGASGADALAPGQHLVHANVPPSRIVSTLGAGDVFHGALLAGLTHLESGSLGGGLQTALEYATVAASLSCRGIDGRSSIPDHEETLSAMASIRTDN